MEKVAILQTDAWASDLRVLIFAPFGKDSLLIEAVLRESGIFVQVCSTAATLIESVGETAGAAIITEEVLRSEALGILAEKLAAQPRWSDFPIIVLTGGGVSTDKTESEVHSRVLPNVSLLERPLRPATLISAVRSVLTARQRQYEIRDHLREREASEQALRRAHDVLETQVEQRTAALRLLSARLMRVQDEERRRIARELHDSLGQYLAAAKINLDVLSTEKSNGNAPYLHEAQNLIERAIADTRTLSHLLHPPLLDEAGFGTAARWFVEGFGRRSRISTTLEMPHDLPRLPAEIEIALFRILQESLTNVHRHSGADKVDVRLTADRNKVTLAVIDHGKGMRRELLERLGKSNANVGVGLAGMRERVLELGGTFDVRSDKSGTRLQTVIPIPQPAEEPRAPALRQSAPGPPAA